MYQDTCFAVMSGAAEIACHYTTFEPSRRNLLSACSPKHLGDEGSDGQGVEASGEPAKAQGSGEADGQRESRKRKRKAYQPNAREQEAEARHNRVEASLKANHAVFRAWMASKGATTIDGALQDRRHEQPGNLGPASASKSSIPGSSHEPPGGSCAPSSEYGNGEAQTTQSAGATDASQSCSRSERDSYGVGEGPGAPVIWPVAERHHLGEGGSGGPRGIGENTWPASGSPEGEADSLDLLRLAQMAAVVKPRFSFLDGAEDVESCNLFNRVIANDAAEDREALAHETRVIIPGLCRFLIADIKDFRLLLSEASSYGCIVADPPWENASVRRSNPYPTLPSRHLLSIPVPALMPQEGGLLVLWMTNREKLHRFVETELLPKWQLQAVATWYWLKCRPDGSLICGMDNAHHRPYERMILAAPQGWQPLVPLPPDFCIISVPEVHSRKPHLGRVLDKFLPQHTKRLELFARELARGWTSAGNQVLQFQAADLFEPCGR